MFGEELGYFSDFSSSGLISLSVFSICGFIDRSSNTAVLLYFWVVYGDTTKGNFFGTNGFADFLQTGPAFAFKADFISCSLVRLSLVSLFMAYSRSSILFTSLFGVKFCLLWQLWYRSLDVTTACNSTFKQPSSFVGSTTGLRLLGREVVDKGHRPKDVFFLCWSFWESDLPVSCVHQSVWLMSQEFPEAESPAGFAALESSARFQVLRTPWVQRVPLPVSFMGPAHGGRRPKNRSSNSQRPPLWSSHPQGLLRGLICRYPLGCHRRSLRSGVSLPSRSQRLRRACLQGPKTPAESRDRISSSASRRKQNTRLEVESRMVGGLREPEHSRQSRASHG